MSENKTYNLLFRGEIAKGFEASTVRTQLGSLLRLESEAELDKLFSGKLITLKKDLLRDEINKYFLAIRKTGAIPEISANAAENPAPQADTAQSQQQPQAPNQSQTQEAGAPNLFALQLSPGIMNNIVRKNEKPPQKIAPWQACGAIVLLLTLTITGLIANHMSVAFAAIDIFVLSMVALLCLVLFIVGVKLSILKNGLYYAPFNAEESRFDISDPEIQWISAIPQPKYKIELLLYTAAILLAAAVLSALWDSIPVLLNIAMVWLSVLLFVQHYAYTRALLCHLGILDNSLIIADHQLHYRVGQHAEVQYWGNHISIGDTVVYSGSKLLPVFEHEDISKLVDPMLRSAIKTDFTSLLVKLALSGHPQFMVYLALIGGGVIALIASMLSLLIVV